MVTPQYRKKFPLFRYSRVRDAEHLQIKICHVAESNGDIQRYVATVYVFIFIQHFHSTWSGFTGYDNRSNGLYSI